MKPHFNSFSDFYLYYLSQHKNSISRVLHAIGSILGTVLFLFGIFYHNYYLFLLAFLFGYGCGWIGHFVFEKNRPATFRYPFYSFVGDFRMAIDLMLGRIKP
ncbi:MAG TPA: DUF962 domain-containing protein [Acidiferrobacterales bacterium]|nr:DUF962 domain-containing protein [Acidiferrobacterales bacterium]